jgi:hypothetical protein
MAVFSVTAQRSHTEKRHFGASIFGSKIAI